MIDPNQPRPQPAPNAATSKVFRATPEAVQAVLMAIVLRQGEPLVNPPRVTFSVSRPDVEAAAGRHLTFEYLEDELNPFGRLDIVVLD